MDVASRPLDEGVVHVVHGSCHNCQDHSHGLWLGLALASYLDVQAKVGKSSQQRPGGLLGRVTSMHLKDTWKCNEAMQEIQHHTEI